MGQRSTISPRSARVLRGERLVDATQPGVGLAALRRIDERVVDADIAERLPQLRGSFCSSIHGEDPDLATDIDVVLRDARCGDRAGRRGARSCRRRRPVSYTHLTLPTSDLV